MAALNVTRCICHNRSFEEIKVYADKHDIETVEELRKRKFCSCGCQMCKPYIEMTLKTGETSFEPGAHYRRNN